MFEKLKTEAREEREASVRAAQHAKLEDEKYAGLQHRIAEQIDDLRKVLHSHGLLLYEGTGARPTGSLRLVILIPYRIEKTENCTRRVDIFDWRADRSYRDGYHIYGQVPDWTKGKSYFNTSGKIVPVLLEHDGRFSSIILNAETTNGYLRDAAQKLVDRDIETRDFRLSQFDADGNPRPVEDFLEALANAYDKGCLIVFGIAIVAAILGLLGWIS